MSEVLIVPELERAKFWGGSGSRRTKTGVQSLSQTDLRRNPDVLGDHVAQSIDRELRGLRRAGHRLEKAAKEWIEAHAIYAAALDELKRKTTPKKQPK
jgi:hypothetical protein